MVKLLIILFSFNSYAQIKKVDIVNSHGNLMSQDVEDEAEANTYIARVKHRWGREDGWYEEQCEDMIETRLVEDVIEYHCPKNYSAIARPLNQAELDAKQLIIDNKEERVRIKTLLSSLKVPETAAERIAWFTKVNRIIKRLVRDSRE